MLDISKEHKVVDKVPKVARLARIACIGLVLFVLVINGLKHCIATAHHRTALQAAHQFSKNIHGKLFIITGGYSGIGAETVKALLAEGGRVVIGGRSPEKLEDFLALPLFREYEFSKHKDDGVLDGYPLDLADLNSVQKFGDYINTRYSNDHKLVLILNAGVICPAAVTKQSFEMQMGTMVIGHFLLSKLLYPRTKRQVWLSSTFHTMLGSPRINVPYYKHFSLDKDASSYDVWVNYQQSKVGVMLLAKEFDRRYGVETASLHPGTVYTDMGKYIYSSPWEIIRDTLEEIPEQLKHEGWWFPLKSPEEGASTSITVAAMPSTELKNGGYYKDCAEFEESDSAQNMEDAVALFDWCDEITKDYQ